MDLLKWIRIHQPVLKFSFKSEIRCHPSSFSRSFEDPQESSQMDRVNGDGKVDVQQQTNTNDIQPNEENQDELWHLVGTFKSTHADIRHYYVVPPKLPLENYVRVHPRVR